MEQDRAPALLAHHDELARPPLTSHEVIVETIAATTTRTGLRVSAALDTNIYPTGVRIGEAEMAALPLTRHAFHGDWNYALHPQPRPVVPAPRAPQEPARSGTRSCCPIPP